MKKIFLVLLITTFSYDELPSYQCKELYYSSYIDAKGKIVPEVKKASGRSKLNVSIVSKNGRIQYLQVNGTNLQVTKTYRSYIYAVEYALNGMHSWVFFKNVDGKTYITLSKTYDLLGVPMTVYSLYGCEYVNNYF